MPPQLAQLLRGRDGAAERDSLQSRGRAAVRNAVGTRAANRFRRNPRRRRHNVQFRERKGDKIDAACGQLRRSTPALLTIGSKT